MSDLFWLTDAQMARLAPFVPKSHGKPRVDDKRVLSGIIFINRNGLRWRDAPAAYGGSSSCCPESKVGVRYLLSRGHAFRTVVPALERGGEALTVSGGGHLVAARAEQVGGFIVGAEEPLRLSCRFETALDFLALSRGSVRSLNTIVQSLVRPVIHVQPELPQGRAVAA